MVDVGLRSLLSTADPVVPCGVCGALVAFDCPLHPQIVAPNALPFEHSLIGEPECVGLYRSRADDTKVGAHAMRDLPANLRFGPWLEEAEEEERKRKRGGRESRGCDLTSSMWMRYVQRTNEESKRNLIAFHQCGTLYFRTCKQVNDNDELLLLHQPFKKPLQPSSLLQPIIQSCVPVTREDESQAGKEKKKRRKRKKKEKKEDKNKEKKEDKKEKEEEMKAMVEVSQNEEGTFGCQLCSASFLSAKGLKIHARFHKSGGPRLVCHICKKSFGKQKWLDRHLAKKDHRLL